MATLVVGAEEQGMRLDRFLRRRLPTVPLSRIFRLIRTSGVLVNGRTAKGGYRVNTGEQIDVQVNEAEVLDEHTGVLNAARLVDSVFFKRSFRVVFEDDAVLVCDKPAGVVVHPGSGHMRGDSLVELASAYLSHHLDTRSPRRAWLVHRIDRDTSGIVLLAKDRVSLVRLHHALRDGCFRKLYTLICHGRPPAVCGRVEDRLVRTYGSRDGTKMVVAEEGREARSSYRVLQSRRGLSLVEVSLETGRTHQIRVQMAHARTPIVGDERYGDSRRDEKIFRERAVERRLYLHASTLSFPHPLSGERVTVSSPIPSSFALLLGAQIEPRCAN